MIRLLTKTNLIIALASNSHYGARLCAKHQPQRVHPPQTLRLVLWTQSRSDQNENCCALAALVVVRVEICKAWIRKA